MAEVDRRPGQHRGGFNNRKRRFREDDESERRPQQQRRRYEEPVHVRLRKQLLSIAESSFKNPADEAVSIAKSLADNYDDVRMRDDFLDLVVQLVIEQPFKVSFAAVIVIAINTQKSEAVDELLAKAVTSLNEHLAAGHWREVKLLLRFLGCLQGLLQGDGVFPVLDELFDRAVDLQTASSEDTLGLELVKIILLTIPYIMASSATRFHDHAIALLDKTDVIASNPHSLEALADPYPDSSEEGRQPQSIISLLQKQLQGEGSQGWTLACISRTWKALPVNEVTEGETKETEHILPTITVPSPVVTGTRPRLPELYFSVYGDQDIETVPPTSNIASSILRDSLNDTIDLLHFNRNATSNFLINVDSYFAPGTFAKRATPFDQLKNIEEGKTTWKPEDVAVDAVFSRLFQLPHPEHKLAYYHSVLTECCKLAPAAIAPSLGRAIRYLYRNIDSMDLELASRFMDWFSHHLSNFGFTWKWSEWVDDVQLSDVYPKKAFIIGALEKEIRLSFAKRIRDTLPEPYRPLISEETEKDTPPFKYDSDQTPYAPSTRTIRQLIRTKAPDADLTAPLQTIESEAAAHSLPDPSLPSTDALITSILFLGSKSFSHVLSYIERCKDRLLAIGQRSPSLARKQIITSVMEYWAAKPGTAVNVVDKLLNYTILSPMSVVEWVVGDNLRKGNILAKYHVYEMLASTLQKVTNRVRQLATARNASTDPAQRALIEETLQTARDEMRLLFTHVEDGLKSVAEGVADRMLDQEGGVDDEEQARLREWGVRWLRVFRRKLAVEESVVGEMLEVEVRDDEVVMDGNGTLKGDVEAQNGGDADVDAAMAVAVEEQQMNGGGGVNSVEAEALSGATTVGNGVSEEFDLIS